MLAQAPGKSAGESTGGAEAGSAWPGGATRAGSTDDHRPLRGPACTSWRVLEPTFRTETLILVYFHR